MEQTNGPAQPGVAPSGGAPLAPAKERSIGAPQPNPIFREAEGGVRRLGKDPPVQLRKPHSRGIRYG
jgi:hypothetical protein